MCTSVATHASNWATALHERADVRRVGSCVMRDSSMRCVVVSSHRCNHTQTRVAVYHVARSCEVACSSWLRHINTLHGGFALHNVCVGPEVSQEGPIGQECPKGRVRASAAAKRRTSWTKVTKYVSVCGLCVFDHTRPDISQTSIENMVGHLGIQGHIDCACRAH